MATRFGIPAYILALAFLGMTGAPASSQTWTMQVDVDGKRYVGSPIAWDSSQLLLLGRSGHLWQLSKSKAENFKKVSGGFSPFSQGEMRGQLLAEFGKSFEISGTGNYLVVHPRGQRNLWAGRFEELYRSFMHYFTARGWRPQRPKFPLVAVVFHNQQEFRRYAAKEGANIGSGVLGYYTPKSNRVLLYDSSRERNEDHWETNAATIIHEAAHQTAFNTGVHSRFAPTPQWVAEGLGTMFEAPGVYNSRHHLNVKDRLNQGRLAGFKRYVLRRKAGSLSEFITSDQLFRHDPSAAYAEAWALSFYLVENYPRDYISYLRTIAARPSFQNYEGQQRLNDFIKHFGRDLRMLETRYLRFLAKF